MPTLTRLNVISFKTNIIRIYAKLSSILSGGSSATTPSNWNNQGTITRTEISHSFRSGGGGCIQKLSLKLIRHGGKD